MSKFSYVPTMVSVCVGFSVSVILVIWMSGSKNDDKWGGQELKSSVELEVPEHTRTLVDVLEVQQKIDDDANYIESGPEQETQETSDEANKTSGLSEYEKSPSSLSVFAHIPLSEISASTNSSPSPKVTILRSFPSRSSDPRISIASRSDPREEREAIEEEEEAASSPSPKVTILTSFPSRSSDPRISKASRSDPREGIEEGEAIEEEEAASSPSPKVTILRSFPSRSSDPRISIASRSDLREGIQEGEAIEEEEAASSPSPKVTILRSFPSRSSGLRISAVSQIDPRHGRKLMLQNY